jgi:hypothetical protein
MKAVQILLAVLAIVCTVVIAQENKEFLIELEDKEVSRGPRVCVLRRCVVRNIEISRCC